MAFNINDFTSNINETGGVAQQHTFMVRILPPASSSANPAVNDFYRHLSFRCDATTFPGRAIQSADSRYGTWGNRKSGGSATYADVGTTIIVSNDFREREFFLDWQDEIVGDHRKEPTLDADERSRSFYTGYYDNYVTRVEILQYDMSSQSVNDWVYRCVLEEAFPIQVNPMSASWESADVQKIDILWAYYYFTDEWRGKQGVNSRKSGLFERLFNTL